MELEMLPRHTHRKEKGRGTLLLFVLLLLFIFSSVTVYYAWKNYYPSSDYVGPVFGETDKPIFYNGQMLAQQALGTNESLKLPLSVVKEHIDPYIIYEEQSDSVIVTTENKVLQMKSNQLTGLINEKPFDLHFSVEKVDDQIYVPIEPLKSLYSIHLRESEENGSVILSKEGDMIHWGETLVFSKKPERTVILRLEPTIKAPIVAYIEQGEPVVILSEQDGWYHIQLTNGYIGHVPKKWIQSDHIETVPKVEPVQVFVPWKPLGGKINLTWEQVTNRNPDTSKIGAMPGLNVVSPTWFELADGTGNIKNRADHAYVKWAHEQNYLVWALFSNGFEPNQTTEALSTYDKRIKMIKQLVSFAQLYKLQGINIDFENVYLKDKDKLTQFVREMVPFMHEQGLVVSIDVTFKSTSEMWSMFYDRPALAEVVDYMMIMAYDEHWAASPIAGSVSSLPWVEKSLLRILEEDKIPPHKLVLGVPFYTRVWTEEVKDGKTSVSSRAVFMDTAINMAVDNKVTPKFLGDIGQHYVEYKEGNKIIKIWLEDEVSMKARMEIVKKYDLAGIASWRRGYENPTIWNVIKETLERRP